MGGLLRGIGFPFGVTISSGESCNGDWRSLAVPSVKNVPVAGTDGKNEMNVPERVYGLYVLTVRKPMVFS